tara:strand:+ start:418 stop:1020 length:603 start_codon:yes stop_codon:yes gene_type:complete
MADFSIKPTAGTGNKLIIKDQAGNAVLTTSDAGATLASNITFDDAHKDIDVDVDSWDLLMGSTVNYTSNTNIDYDWTHKLGSNCTESAGVVTVAKAGWYFVTTCVGQKAQETQQVDIKFQISDPAGSAGNTSYVQQPGRILIVDPNAGESYGISSMSWLVYLRATDKCCMNGTGHLYGNTTSVATEINATNRFIGFRIGA